MVPVYGAAQEDKKSEFLAELVRMCGTESLPILVGGDFNILRKMEDKNNNNFNPRWPFLFNAIIENLDLREIDLSGRQFTWANRRDTPTFEKLDRILASVEWEQKFPLVSVRTLTRTGSDHTPLLLDSGNHAHIGISHISRLNSRGLLMRGSTRWLQPNGLQLLEGTLLLRDGLIK